MKTPEQINCYGETIEEMEAAFRRFNSGKYDFERTMYAMSILSDVQHIMASKAYGDQTQESHDSG